MVAPEDRARAVGVLERLGFAEDCPWMPVSLSLDPGGTAFNRAGDGVVDLHCRLPGARRKDDRALPYANDSGVNEYMVGSMQRDVHAQLGVEDAERESQIKRACDWFLVAHDV